MPEHSTQFEATAGGLVLTNAILLYQGETASSARGLPSERSPAFASIHSVDHVDGQPTIAAGAPLQRAHLRQWTAALGRAAAPEILPDNVLVSHPDMLVWWVPEQVRPAYFRLTSPPEGLQVLAKQTTVSLPYPAHLFVATRSSLGVYALPESRRPDADTQLLYSPVLNVFVSGHLCWGNIPKPKRLTIAAMPEFERAVFDSWSTHPNPGQEVTVKGKGGLVRLWDQLAARKAKRFPVKRLKPFTPGSRRNGLAGPVTLGNLIAGVAKA